MPYNDPDELTGYEEYLRDTTGPQGDPRRCPVHPHVMTSSDDGMFDGVCGECEYLMGQTAEEWKYDPENPRRPYCGYETLILFPEPRYLHVARCVDVEDDIPF